MAPKRRISSSWLAPGGAGGGAGEEHAVTRRASATTMLFGLFMAGQEMKSIFIFCPDPPRVKSVRGRLDDHQRHLQGRGPARPHHVDRDHLTRLALVEGG